MRFISQKLNCDQENEMNRRNPSIIAGCVGAIAEGRTIPPRILAKAKSSSIIISSLLIIDPKKDFSQKWDFTTIKVLLSNPCTRKCMYKNRVPNFSDGSIRCKYYNILITHHSLRVNSK